MASTYALCDDMNVETPIVLNKVTILSINNSQVIFHGGNGKMSNNYI